MAVLVVDPDLLMWAQFGDAGRVARFVAGVVGCRRVEDDCVDACPALQEDVVIDHHRVADASRHVVVQQLSTYPHTFPVTYATLESQRRHGFSP